MVNKKTGYTGTWIRDPSPVRKIVNGIQFKILNTSHLQVEQVKHITKFYTGADS